MEEEFHENDIIFPEHDAIVTKNVVVSDSSSCLEIPKRKKKRKNNTVPIDIPENKENLDVKCVGMHFSDDEKELVPPHLIVGRRVYASKMAFSVCSGKGRTLKGRDLRQVRNSILRMTGFLET